MLRKAQSKRKGMGVSETQVVNALVEALDNATGPAREPARVGRLLARCQQRCPEWFRECQRYDRESWIRILITPGVHCEWCHGVE